MQSLENSNKDVSSPPSKKQRTTTDSNSSVHSPFLKTPFTCGAFDNGKNIIEEGDLVIVYLSEEDVRPIYIKREEMFQCKFGNFKHEQFIGKSYGCTVSAEMTENQKKCHKTKKMDGFRFDGYVILLRPTPLLWTKALPHRTQILYNVDIGMVCQMLKLKPGKRVVESGTGSGSLSHTMARLIAPTGHLFTFEFHEHRFNEARNEFDRHGLGSVVSITHRDVCQDGFLIDDPSLKSLKLQAHSIDAVFLDLPKPWLAIEHARKILKDGGAICTFSPCIEQVQKNCQKLRDMDFYDIRTIECLSREYFYQRVAFQDPVVNSLLAAEITAKNEEARREELKSKTLIEKNNTHNSTSIIQNNETTNQINNEANHETGDKGNSKKNGKKKNKNQSNGNKESSSSSSSSSSSMKQLLRTQETVENFLLSQNEMRGHTSYLTFAKVSNFTKTSSETTFQDEEN